MIDWVEQCSDLKPERLIGDTACGTAEMLHRVVDGKAIEPHVPVWEKSEHNDDTSSRSALKWREEDNVDRCPGGKPLRGRHRNFAVPRSRTTEANTIICRASKHDCKRCPLKAQCCPNTAMRKMTRQVNE